MRTYTYNDLQQHRTTESCWVVLYGNVYDVTEFLPNHPGGSKIILQLAGNDATEEYDPVHPPGTLEENLPPQAKLGSFDSTTLPQVAKPRTSSITDMSSAQPSSKEENSLMTIEECLNLDDIEALATKKISRKAWGYYFSAGDDLRSKYLNNTVYSDILLRPRIFVDVSKCELSTSILGQNVNVPFFVSPAAMARLGHPDGEHGIAQACGKYGVAQIISNNASQSPEQIVANSAPGQIFGWQIYVQNDRQKSIDMLARIAKLPQIKFIVLTLDAPVPGKREDDERSQSVGAQLPVSSSINPNTPTSDAEGIKIDGAGGVGKALFAGTAPDLTWQTTLPWLSQHTHLPIVLKGIQTHEDAYIASLHASHVKGIILSNHGGRAVDTAPPAIHTLLEIRKFCPEVLSKLEVYVDGGIRRGTDVVKALALGARAVGLGRAPLYGNGAAGARGVERVFEILRAEVDTAMRLLGVARVADLRPFHVNTRKVERDIYDGPEAVNRGMWVRSKL